MLHRLDDFYVAGATANIAAERLAYLRVARIGIAAQEPGRRHDIAGRAIAALRAEFLVKSTLHGRQMAILGERLDRVDAAAFDAHRKRQAGQAWRVIDQHRAGAAFAAVAAGFRSGHPDYFPQIVQQQKIIGNRVVPRAAIERKLKNARHAGLGAFEGGMNRRRFHSNNAEALQTVTPTTTPQRTDQARKRAVTRSEERRVG